MASAVVVGVIMIFFQYRHIGDTADRYRCRPADSSIADTAYQYRYRCKSWQVASTLAISLILVVVSCDHCILI